MSRDLYDFWRGKRVFLTGHTGFKGCWLTLWLEILGAKVFGYSLAPQEPSLYSAVFPLGRDDESYADVRDRDRLKQEMTAFSPEIVFHLAAQPLVRESYKEPVVTYETNVMGTVHLLQAARCTDTVKSIVIITTDKCYKDMDWQWGYRETDTLGGADPYSSSKACAELVCDAWRHSYFSKSEVLLASARAGNVIGGGDWAEDRLVPDAIRAFQKGEPLLIRSPGAVRPWQHVLEPLNGYMTLAMSLYGGDHSCACGWNFGPPAEGSRDVRSVVECLVELWGEGAAYRVTEDHSLHESHLLRLDSSSAIQKLHWQRKFSLEEAITLTVEWYKSVSNKQDPLSATRGQILDYMEACGYGRER